MCVLLITHLLYFRIFRNKMNIFRAERAYLNSSRFEYIRKNILDITKVATLPVAFRKSPLGDSFLQLLIAVESPFVAFGTGWISMVVHTQSFSKKAPPAVWIFPISYHNPLYLAFVKLLATWGVWHPLLEKKNPLAEERRNACENTTRNMSKYLVHMTCNSWHSIRQIPCDFKMFKVRNLSDI